MHTCYGEQADRTVALLLFVLGVAAGWGAAIATAQEATAAAQEAIASAREANLKAERPAVKRISFAVRSDRRGYVVRVRTTGAVGAYGAPRVREGRIEWKIYNTRTEGPLQAESVPQLVEGYRAEAQGSHLQLRFELRSGVEVEAQAYRDGASDDLLMNVIYEGDVPARLASAEASSEPDSPEPSEEASDEEAPDEGRAGETRTASSGRAEGHAEGPPGTAGERWKLDTIVLDAGHGGKDPGARAHDLDEKDVVLDITRKVGGYIEERLPGVDVVYTRKDDRFIPLSERGKIANRAGGKLFVSIHANAARNHSAYGTETYFLGTHKSEAARKVMERENSVVRFEESTEEYEELDPEALAMQTLAQSAYMRQSEHLAGLVQDQFQNRVERKDRGVHQAGFYVLWSASMPAVLVETGFLTNRQEARFLGSERGKTLLASGIFRAVRAFKKQYEKGLDLAAE